MIKISQASHSPIKAALYYVQIKTHSDSRLFSLPVSLPESDLDKNKLLSASALAQIAADELLLAAVHRDITVKEWVVLPDALQAFVLLPAHSRDSHEGVGKPRLLTSFVASFKAASAKRINLLRNQPGASVWQRSYQEQLIEDKRVLQHWQAKMSKADGVVMSSQMMSKPS